MALDTGLAITSSVTGGNAEAAALGCAYVATTPTPGTGIIGFATSTTLAIGEVNPDFVCYNPGPNTIYPLYLRLHVTVISTASTDTKYTFFMDSGNNLTTIATALTKTNTNPISPNVSQAVVAVGANVRSLANNGSLRVVGHTLLRGTIDVVHDTYGFFFGIPDAPSSVSVAATVMEVDRVMQPIAIPPGWMLCASHWNASQSASITAEYEFGYIER